MISGLRMGHLLHDVSCMNPDAKLLDEVCHYRVDRTTCTHVLF